MLWYCFFFIVHLVFSYFIVVHLLFVNLCILRNRTINSKCKMNSIWCVHSIEWIFVPISIFILIRVLLFVCSSLCLQLNIGGAISSSPETKLIFEFSCQTVSGEVHKSHREKKNKLQVYQKTHRLCVRMCEACKRSGWWTKTRARKKMLIYTQSFIS